MSKVVEVVAEVVAKVLGGCAEDGRGCAEGGGGCAEGGGGCSKHSFRSSRLLGKPRAVVCVTCVVLYAVLYAAPYSGGRGVRAPSDRGARVMRYVLELHGLRTVSAGSCAPCARGREGHAACAVGSVMCCELLFHGRCVTCMVYAGGWALYSMRSRCWRICVVYCSRYWRLWKVSSVRWR